MIKEISWVLIYSKTIVNVKIILVTNYKMHEIFFLKKVGTFAKASLFSF